VQVSFLFLVLEICLTFVQFLFYLTSSLVSTKKSECVDRLSRWFSELNH